MGARAHTHTYKVPTLPFAKFLNPNKEKYKLYFEEVTRWWLWYTADRLNFFFNVNKKDVKTTQVLLRNKKKSKTRIVIIIRFN